MFKQEKQNDRIIINDDDDILDVKDDDGGTDVIADDIATAPPNFAAEEPLKVDVSNELNVTLSTPFDAPAAAKVSAKQEVMTIPG